MNTGKVPSTSDYRESMKTSLIFFEEISVSEDYTECMKTSISVIRARSQNFRYGWPISYEKRLQDQSTYYVSCSRISKKKVGAGLAQPYGALYPDRSKDF